MAVLLVRDRRKVCKLHILLSKAPSSKLQGINPWDYIIDVLEIIDHRSAINAHELTSKNWKE